MYLKITDIMEYYERFYKISNFKIIQMGKKRKKIECDPLIFCLNIQIRHFNAHFCRNVKGEVRKRKMDRDNEITIRPSCHPRLNRT